MTTARRSRAYPRVSASSVRALGRIGTSRWFASLLRRRRLLGGDELSVLDGIFAVLAAVRDRAQAAVGEHHQTVFALLLDSGKVDLEVQQAVVRNLRRQHLVLVADVAEVAAKGDAAVGADLIGQHRAVGVIRRQRAVDRPSPEQSPLAHGLRDGIVGGRVRCKACKKGKSQRKPDKASVQITSPCPLCCSTKSI